MGIGAMMASAGIRTGSTLRGDGVGGVATRRGGTGTETGPRSGLGVAIRPVMSSDRSFNVLTWLSVIGSIGEPGVGLRRASRISGTPARMRSLEEAMGIDTFLVGNQDRVSQMRMDRVSQIQTL